jgi:hypothetical protein
MVKQNFFFNLSSLLLVVGLLSFYTGVLARHDPFLLFVDVSALDESFFKTVEFVDKSCAWDVHEHQALSYCLYCYESDFSKIPYPLVVGALVSLHAIIENQCNENQALKDALITTLRKFRNQLESGKLFVKKNQLNQQVKIKNEIKPLDVTHIDNLVMSQTRNPLLADRTAIVNIIMGNQGEIKFQELTVNGANTASLQAPANLAGDYILTLPINAGAASQVLTTNGSGVLSWTTPVGGGDIVNGGQTGPITVGTNDATVFNLETNNTNRLVISSAGTVTIGNLTPAGVVHNSAAGLLTSSLIVNADVSASAAIVDTKLATISTAGKVANSATTGTASNAINTLVLRDGSGNFAAGTITASLTGAASLNVLKAGDTMTGALVMDNQQQIRFRETTGMGINFAAIRAPATLAADYTLTLPINSGAVNYVLTTDGTGVLSWTDGSLALSDDRVNVYVGANQTITPPQEGIPQIIGFNKANINPNTNFDTTTFRYKVPKSGTYFVGVNLSDDNNNSFNRTVQVYVNAVPQTGYSVEWRNSDVPIALTGIIALKAGLLVDVRYIGKSGDILLANSTSLSIHILSTQ